MEGMDFIREVMDKVERHRFIPPQNQHEAHLDTALAIGHGQTISQPYIVALMTQSAKLKPTDVVLEIGTGSGYQAAVLSHIVKQTYTIEILEPLAREAQDRLKTLGYENVTVRHGDGYRGWAEQAPFDAILLTAAAPKVPQSLIEQLKVGGHMVLPLGKAQQSQELVVLTKQTDGKLKTTFEGGVVFVPMTGKIQKEEAP